jgi:CubicO group peptidase (beta-lactamase class C family)
MRDGRLAFASGHGGRDANERVPVRSLSKAITALCIASLIREKRLGLGDPIGPLLAPIFSKYGDPADERFTRITVAQLLTHRGGIPRTVDGENLFAPGLTELLRRRAPRNARIETLLPEIVKVRLVRDAGAEFEYTNIGYVLLGQIIEVLTGRSYEAACAERVLARAGVGNTPSLDRNWGGVMQSAAGWALSGPEYLAFARLLEVPDRELRFAGLGSMLVGVIILFLVR